MIFIELAYVSTLNQTNLEENSLTRYLNANHVLTFIGLQKLTYPSLVGHSSHSAGTVVPQGWDRNGISNKRPYITRAFKLILYPYPESKNKCPAFSYPRIKAGHINRQGLILLSLMD